MKRIVRDYEAEKEVGKRIYSVFPMVKEMIFKEIDDGKEKHDRPDNHRGHT